MSESALGLTLLDPAAFNSEKALHWLVAPFFPEHFEDFTLPVLVGGQTLVVSVRGMILPAGIEDEAVLSLDGHTSSFNSRITWTRSGTSHRLVGNYNGETLDYTVALGHPTSTVVGDTGKFHARYDIDETEGGLHVHGNTSGLHSDYLVSLQATGLAFKGIDAGENTHYELQTNDSGWHWKGELSKGFIDLSATAEGSTLLLAGTVDSKGCRLVVEVTEGVLRLHGFTNWGPVDFTATLGEAGYKVHGRADHNILDYMVLFGVRPRTNPFDVPTVKVDHDSMDAEDADMPSFLRSERIADNPDSGPSQT